MIYLFYLPGSFLGALCSDWLGPRQTLAIGVALQGVVGFIMSGCYQWLGTTEYMGAFIVVYGYEHLTASLFRLPLTIIVSSWLWANLVLVTTLAWSRPRLALPPFGDSTTRMPRPLERSVPLWALTSFLLLKTMPPTRFELVKILSSFPALFAS